MEGLRYQKGIPKNFLREEKYSLWNNTCAGCGLIPTFLNVHFIPKYLSSLRESEECKRRLCDACFQNLCKGSERCPLTNCFATIKKGTKTRKVENNVSGLIFLCFLTPKCNQRLTFADFCFHTHEHTERKKKSPLENAQPAVRESRMGNNNASSSARMRSGNLYPDVPQTVSNDLPDRPLNQAAQVNDDHSRRDPQGSQDKSGNYPSKFYEDGSFSFTNGDYVNQCEFAYSDNKDEQPNINASCKKSQKYAQENMMNSSVKNENDRERYSERSKKLTQPEQPFSQKLMKSFPDDQTSLFACAVENLNAYHVSMQSVIQKLTDDLESEKKGNKLGVESEIDSIKIQLEMEKQRARESEENFKKESEELAQIINQQFKKIQMMEASEKSAEKDLKECRLFLAESKNNYQLLESQSDKVKKKYSDMKKEFGKCENELVDCREELKYIKIQFQSQCSELDAERENARQCREDYQKLREEYNELMTNFEQSKKFALLLNQNNEKLQNQIEDFRKSNRTNTPRETATDQRNESGSPSKPPQVPTRNSHNSQENDGGIHPRSNKGSKSKQKPDWRN